MGGEKRVKNGGEDGEEGRKRRMGEGGWEGGWRMSVDG